MYRSDVIQKIINHLKAKNYVEIGVAQGRCFAVIRCDRKAGIDPRPAAENVSKILDEKTKYFQMRSDDFFKGYEDAFGGDTIDVAFIDGLHTFKQSLKDVENCLQHLNEGGVIVLHDCNPETENLAGIVEVPGKGKVYVEGTASGDVWRTIITLRSLRHDLRVFTLNCDRGLGIVTKGKPETKLGYTLEEIKNMSYEELDNNRSVLLNLRDESYLDIFLGQHRIQ